MKDDPTKTDEIILVSMIMLLSLTWVVAAYLMFK